MKNKSDEEVIEFFFVLLTLDYTKYKKSLSFFDLPDHLKHDSNKGEFIHYMTEDGKPIIKFTIRYTASEDEGYTFQKMMYEEGYCFKGSKRLGGGFNNV